MRSPAGIVLAEEIQSETEVVLGKEDPSLEGERGRLRFFLSFIDLKRRVRKTLSAGYRYVRWMATQDDEDTYSPRSVTEQQ
jgi:hypothetical protein